MPQLQERGAELAVELLEAADQVGHLLPDEIVALLREAQVSWTDYCIVMLRFCPLVPTRIRTRAEFEPGCRNVVGLSY